MSIKEKLIACYDNIYTSNFVLNAIYRYQNRAYRLKILSSEETIDHILKSNCSIARFGDGEFEMLLQPNRDLGFQAHNGVLSERMKKVLESKNPNLLICVPFALNDLHGRTKHSRMFWYFWGKRNDQHHRIVKLIRQCQPTGYIYGDSQITRSYIAYATRNHGARIFPMLRKLWEGKDILFVEGEKTRLGVGNDLFNNARSIKRVLCPATNAFDRYEEILDAVKFIWNGELILLALGPTATVLAAELADNGIQALDIGHIDIEYEWFRSDAKGHDQVAGKFTNEAAAQHVIDACEDEAYLNQIIGRVGC